MRESNLTMNFKCGVKAQPGGHKVSESRLPIGYSEELHPHVKKSLNLSNHVELH